MVFEKRVPIQTGLKSRRRATPPLGKKPKKSAMTESLTRALIRVGVTVFVVLAMAIIGYMTLLAFTLPDVRSITKTLPNESTRIYSADGVILADLHQEENRSIVPLSHINTAMQKAVVALEDARFYRHHGIDPIGIFRATIVNVIRQEKAQGASTLTQQLARNLFLSKKKRFVRKIQEIVLAFKLERHFTKDEILEMYLNQVYWGHNAYGIEAAATQYLDKHAEELTIAESALLAGMLQAPEYYSPFKNPKAALDRKDVVLKRMMKTRLITKSQYDQAKAQRIKFASRQRLKFKAPYFTSAILEKLIQMYGEQGVYNGGLKVYTPINFRMQEAAEDAVEKAIEKGKAESLGFSQAAVLAMDSNTGQVLAMVGGYDFLHNQFNKCTQAMRQPGSSFKPFIYLSALAKGVSPGTIFTDAPIMLNTAMGPYSPANFGNEYDGRMPLRIALGKSKNVVAVRLVSMIRPETVIETARLFGITTPLFPYLSIALGSQETTMLEMTSAYAAFANGGTLMKPVLINKIEDRNGIVIYREKEEGQKVFDTNQVYALVDMMRATVEMGTGTAAKLPRPMAGKTGTTSDYRDAWFIGYVPQMAVATWVGNDNNSPMNKVTGGSIPAIMWRDFMKVALINVPMLDFPKPAGMVPVNICWISGKKASQFCPQTSVENFWEGHQPSDYCDVHGGGPAKEKAEEGKPSWVKDFLE